jgi:16S rRNA (cytosine967-C5)-methyltransferase
MRPDARAQAAIDVLDLWLEQSDGLDRVLAAWGRQNRFAGSGDRHAIADLVYGAVRRMRSAGWVTGAVAQPSGRQMLLGALIMDGVDPTDTFSGQRYAPTAVQDAELADARELGRAPRGVRLDYPAWLEPELVGFPDAALEALRRRAPLFLRVNTLKTSPEETVKTLGIDGIEAEPVDGVPAALRVTAGARRVRGCHAYLSGLVEIQDAASQDVAAHCGAEPGMTVLDLCAGGGGKTLALGASMKGKGRLLAHDLSRDRMKDLETRSVRAGIEVEIVAPQTLDPLRGVPDLIVVDAPCSGSGAWRRNPDAKWRLSPSRLAELQAIQAGLIDQAIGLVRPGGRVAYITCSILKSENQTQIEAALSRHSGLRLAGERTLLPGEDGDGFFLADLETTHTDRAGTRS